MSFLRVAGIVETYAVSFHGDINTEYLRLFYPPRQTLRDLIFAVKDVLRGTGRDDALNWDETNVFSFPEAGEVALMSEANILKNPGPVLKLKGLIHRNTDPLNFAKNYLLLCLDGRCCLLRRQSS
jgi:hypothetical protein